MTDASGGHQSNSGVIPADSNSIPGLLDENQTSSALGKRHRNPEDGDNIPGVIEAGQEVGMSENAVRAQVIRPPRKRGKLAEKELSPEALAQRSNPDLVEEVDEAELPPPVPRAPRGPAFTVFSGPEEPPEPPRTDSERGSQPSSQTRTPSNGATPSIATSTANRAENQAPSTGNNAFAFNFANSIFQQPAPSTPAVDVPMVMPALEAPTSPTPAYVERNGRRERNDPFHPLGPPRRPPSQASRPASRGAVAPSTSSDAQRTGEATVSPAVLVRAPPLPTLPEEPRSTAEGQTANTAAESASTLPAHHTPPSGPAAGSSSSTLPPSSSGAPLPTPAPATAAAAAAAAVGAPATATMLQAAAAGLARTGGLTIPGLAPPPLPFVPDTPAPPARRTLYGTERDMDTRFGDFGLEGVASLGFWGAAPGAL